MTLSKEVLPERTDSWQHSQRLRHLVLKSWKDKEMSLGGILEYNVLWKSMYFLNPRLKLLQYWYLAPGGKTNSVRCAITQQIKLFYPSLTSACFIASEEQGRDGYIEVLYTSVPLGLWS